MTGCASLQHWGRIVVIEAHEALDDSGVAAKTNTTPIVIPAVIPEVTTGKPDAKACSCDISKPPAKAYEDIRAITIANPQWEECGLESQYKILVRPIVSYDRHILSVSSILDGAVKIVNGGYEVACPVIKHGYSWHVIGYSLGDDHAERMQVRFKKGDRIFIPRDGKRAFVFVEGRK